MEGLSEYPRQTSMEDQAEAEGILESSAQEQSEIDNLLVKLTTSGLGFSVAIDAFDRGNETPWLKAAWLALLLAVVAVLVSKYVAVYSHRNYYEGKLHLDERRRAKLNARAGLGFSRSRCRLAVAKGRWRRCAVSEVFAERSREWRCWRPTDRLRPAPGGLPVLQPRYGSWSGVPGHRAPAARAHRPQ